jgi:hypothetical protein
MPPPGCDTLGVVTRIRAVPWLALFRLPAASRCRDSYSIVKVRGEPHCVCGRVVTSREDCSRPGATRTRLNGCLLVQL